jgi:hypothetical protein
MGRIADAVNGAKVLVYDIETRPMTSMHWGARDQNISPEQVLDSGGVLCWAAKWLDKPRVMYAGDHHDGHDAMVTRLWELLDAADIVIGYNQVGFDDKRMNVEFRRLGLPVPAPVKSVDLLRAVRARFGYPMNKLQSVAGELGVGRKVPHTGWAMWKACITDDNGYPYLGPVPEGGGDACSWNLMRRYCKGDVTLTEDVYRVLLDGGWIKNHPHVGLYGGRLDGCPICGGDTVAHDKTFNTASRVYDLLRCVDCGATCRPAKSTGVTTGTRSV